MDHTLEQCCLMKDDKVFVSVKKDNSLEVERAAEVEKSDELYFRQLANLMPDLTPGADVVFDCTGKSGDGQQLLATKVKGHAGIISARCEWLGAKIAQSKALFALNEMPWSSSSSDNDDGRGRALRPPSRSGGQAASLEPPAVIIEDGSGSARAPYGDIVSAVDGGSADGGGSSGTSQRCTSSASDTARSSPQVIVNESTSAAAPPTSKPPLVVVQLPQHPPEAFKIFLEYVYTNRSICLGQKAFCETSVLQGDKELTEEELAQLGTNEPNSIVEDENGNGQTNDIFASQTTIWHKETKLNKEPVPPFPNGKWPFGGKPTVRMHDILSTLRLADESGLLKLSRMCEIAASELLSPSNVATVLSVCTSLKERSGNEMPILVRACMNFILDVNNISKTTVHATFTKTLTEQKSVLVPFLLDGLVKVMPESIDMRSKRSSRDLHTLITDEDDNDFKARSNERTLNNKQNDRIVPLGQPFTYNSVLDEWYRDVVEDY